MTARRIAVWITYGFSFVLFFSAPAIAQQNELSLTFGGSFSTGTTFASVCEALPTCTLTTNGVAVSPGFSINADFAHRLMNVKAASLFLEMPVLASPSRSGPGFLGNNDFSSVFFTPSVRFQFAPGAGISPFLSGGAGFAHFSGEGSATPWATQFGGGLDFKTHLPHLGFRVEARDFINGKPAITNLGGISSGHLQQIFAGGGVVLKF